MVWGGDVGTEAGDIDCVVIIDLGTKTTFAVAPTEIVFVGIFAFLIIT